MDALLIGHCGLPRVATQQRVWTWESTLGHLTVRAGTLSAYGRQFEQPLPQGPYARLILAELAAYAHRHRTLIVPLEDSAEAYAQTRLGLLAHGRDSDLAARVRREVQALASARFEIRPAREVASVETTKHPEPPPAPQPSACVRQTIWPSWLTLPGELLARLEHSTKTLDVRVCRHLRGSAIAQDIYVWLACITPRLRAPQLLSWQDLAGYFGSDACTLAFQREFMRRLGQVQAAYPGARLRTEGRDLRRARACLRVEPAC